MIRTTVLTAAAVALATVVAPLSSADPVAPQQDQLCPPTADEATTMPTTPAPASGANTPLQCHEGHWQAVALPAEPSDRWWSTGPAIALHGQGMRNPNLLSGTWSGTPLAPGNRCRVEQRAVISAGVVGAPVVTDGAPDQTLHFDVAPTASSVEFSGYCLWTRLD
ncbi:hypothetical protein [Mycolicibacterium aubagnense]|uniref:Secreted protein n=1 Tax=Mycolicibacterium aubagnense TaxID=319707 RepID=A0ABN5YVX0_9MYCO|nr:hypothetical protein [Mycolicibacterium aubagnense]WGI32427.1 hypothetical protein QDT91_25190 [Mycolicibacterium aubagnense]BBX86000.1 hypothetical protein MAUB_38730 [Mycolicibacterium aubagnense]